MRLSNLSDRRRNERKDRLIKDNILGNQTVLEAKSRKLYPLLPNGKLRLTLCLLAEIVEV